MCISKGRVFLLWVRIGFLEYVVVFLELACKIGPSSNIIIAQRFGSNFFIKMQNIPARFEVFVLSIDRCV